MTALLVASILLISFGGIAFFRRNRHLDSEQPPLDAAPPYSGLFGDQEPPAADIEDAESARLKLKEALVERLRAGDVTALEEANRLADRSIYENAADAAIEIFQQRQGGLKPLVCCIVQSKELRATPRLAQAVLKQWQDSPEAISAPDVLHISALSDDASTFQDAMKELLSYHRVRPFLPHDKLRALIESEYWVLSSDARRSPAGFLLKEEIAAIRREAEKNASHVEG